MTRSEMKKEILKTITKEAFEKRYYELIDWNTATQATAIIYNEINTKPADAAEIMHEVFYGIG